MEQLTLFYLEKFKSKLIKYFNILEENNEHWLDANKIPAMVQSICCNNHDMIKNNPWIHNLRDKLQENWNRWDFSKAVEYFNSKARLYEKPKRSISDINRKKGHGNKSKKSQSDTVSTDGNS
mmetsp:Transcript_4586/g.6966  ORF Transcript_4586/g.6966 Transcript_4586/m.6966 type:complete len:122 (-) Transcript_4586:1128-1493(-)